MNEKDFVYKSPTAKAILIKAYNSCIELIDSDLDIRPRVEKDSDIVRYKGYIKDLEESE